MKSLIHSKFTFSIYYSSAGPAIDSMVTSIAIKHIVMTFILIMVSSFSEANLREAVRPLNHGKPLKPTL
ncbi:hypothetical protein N8Z06_00790 [Salibacteraceae bacterium]|jgi:hypothetical protein|nr:hypothetical protein [Salibacteraceae bacterium]